MKMLIALDQRFRLKNGVKHRLDIVPTPSKVDGSFSTRFAEKAFEEQDVLQKKFVSCVVLTSTVMPGATRNILLPILEKFSGKSVAKISDCVTVRVHCAWNCDT